MPAPMKIRAVDYILTNIKTNCQSNFIQPLCKLGANFSCYFGLHFE